MTLHPPGGMIFDKHDKSRRYLTLMTGYSAYKKNAFSYFSLIPELSIHIGHISQWKFYAITFLRFPPVKNKTLSWTCIMYSKFEVKDILRANHIRPDHSFPVLGPIKGYFRTLDIGLFFQSDTQQWGWKLVDTRHSKSARHSTLHFHFSKSPLDTVIFKSTCDIGKYFTLTLDTLIPLYRH